MTANNVVYAEYIRPGLQVACDSCDKAMDSTGHEDHSAETQIQDIDGVDTASLQVKKNQKYEILAIVNGRLITNYDLEQYVRFNDIFDDLTKEIRAQKNKEAFSVIDSIKPGIKKDNDLNAHEEQDKYKNALNALILDYIKITTAAKMYKLVIQKVNVNNHLTSIAKSLNKTKEDLLQLFADNNVSENNVHIFISAMIVWEVIKHNIVAPNVKVSQKQIKDAMDIMMRSYGKTEYLVAELFVNKNKKSTTQDLDQTKTFAQKLHKAATEGKISFQDLVLRYSDSPSRKQGGFIGWLNQDKLISQNIIQSNNDDIDTGYVSDVIEKDQGFFIYNIPHKRTLPEPSQAFLVRYLSLKYPSQETNLAKAKQIKAELSSCVQMQQLADTHPDKAKVSKIEKIEYNKIPDSLKSKLPKNITAGTISDPIILKDQVRLFMVCNLTEAEIIGQIKAQITQEIRQQIINLQLSEFLKIMILNSKVQLKTKASHLQDLIK